MKPKLLAFEVWQLGDLVIASPFLERASERYDVTLLAKPFALDFQPRFWPSIKVIPFRAPWTAFSFRDKYRLRRWPWRSLASILRQLRRTQFDVAVSARWDPRDHLLLRLSGARRRLGYPRMRSGWLLTDSLSTPEPEAHRYEYWRKLGIELGLDMPPREEVRLAPTTTGRTVIIHSGAAQPVRVWPLPRYLGLVRQLRAAGCSVRVLCDPETRGWWLHSGEAGVITPSTVAELLNAMAGGGAFIGNDSGPGHLAARLGIPTFTLFGPQLPIWFLPLHPDAECVEGKPCPYKPCSDYCRYPTPHCLTGITEEEVWPRLRSFLRTKTTVRLEESANPSPNHEHQTATGNLMGGCGS